MIIKTKVLPECHFHLKTNQVCDQLNQRTFDISICLGSEAFPFYTRYSRTFYLAMDREFGCIVNHMEVPRIKSGTAALPEDGT